MACGGKGDYARAPALLDDVMAACANSGETFIRARALNTAGWIRCELQDHERALELNEQSLALAGLIETADTEIGSNARLNIGDSYLALGRLDEAEGHFQAVERIVRNPRPQDRWMLWRYAQHLFHSCAELWLARGDTVQRWPTPTNVLPRRKRATAPRTSSRRVGCAERCSWCAASSRRPKRSSEGRTKPEIIRCLKRYIARELYPVLLAATSTVVSADTSTSPSGV